MEKPDSELDADSPEHPSEELVPVKMDDSSTLEDRHPSGQTEFTPWQEESLPAHATSKLGHRRIIKSVNVLRGEPVKITPHITLEPEPEPESMEITPLIEDDTIVGLRMTCGCGATHEVRFEYGEEQ